MGDVIMKAGLLTITLPIFGIFLVVDYLLSNRKIFRNRPALLTLADIVLVILTIPFLLRGAFWALSRLDWLRIIYFPASH